MDHPKRPRSHRSGRDDDSPPEPCAPEPCAPDPCAPRPGEPGQRLSRVVERQWIFEPCDAPEDACGDGGYGSGGGGHGGDGGGSGGGGSGGGGHGGGGSGGGGGPGDGGDGDPNPNRPTRPAGSDTGRLPDGGPLNKGDIQKPNPPGVFVGPRSDMDLPYLFMRANAADLGKRPITTPFWESPDIMVLAGVTPVMAPPIPPKNKLGDVALAGEPNTLYAHIWNFGKAGAHEVLVEFYWCDPSLGITAGSVRLIAQVMTSLGHKGSGKCHRVVKCPEAWSPAFLNGGHECLLVRVWDNPSDFPGEPKFDASWNRHVAQRNIHVVKRNGGPMPLMLHPAAAPLIKPAFQDPLLLKVGNLYGEPARVEVARAAPSDMPWLQLHTGVRGTFPAAAPPTGAPMLSPPAEGGAGFPAGGAPTQHVVGDDQVIAFSTSDHAPAPGQAHIYRVSAHQGGVVFGGYTIVVLG